MGAIIKKDFQSIQYIFMQYTIRLEIQKKVQRNVALEGDLHLYCTFCTVQCTKKQLWST